MEKALPQVSSTESDSPVESVAPPPFLKLRSKSHSRPMAVGRVFLRAADRGLDNGQHEEELSNVEQQCLAQCSQKLSVFFGSYFAQQAAIQRQVSTQRNTSEAAPQSKQ